MAINVPALPLISSVRLKTDTFEGICMQRIVRFGYPHPASGTFLPACGRRATNFNAHVSCPLAPRERGEGGPKAGEGSAYGFEAGFGVCTSAGKAGFASAGGGAKYASL